jgi:hypothetical protein
MSNSFQMPRNPADFRPPSLVGADGVNQFADADPTPVAADAGDEPFRPPAASEGPVYKVTGYETTLPHRGGLILTLGWLGVGSPFAGVLLLAIYAWVDRLESAIPMFPLVILTLIFSLPAWIMSSVDMKALNAGAMDPEGRRRTYFGGWLGVAGTFLGLFLGLPALAIMIYWVALKVMGVI